ncbi:MAG TPA: Fic family protein, partial [Isosphaeraceae bacterium]|nr:Fic family protein [Isosphaeraceae bacterium]
NVEEHQSCRLLRFTLHKRAFGGQDFYPDLIDKAAVLACHMAWNHPLPDGNKRASWACLVTFLDLNGVIWNPDPPDVDEAEEAVLAVAAHEVDEVWFASWLRERTRQEYS